MNSECFFTKSLILFSSKNSKLSDFICKTIYVPLTIPLSSVSFVTEKVPPADDSQTYYSSSADFETTVTLSATK